MGKKQRTAAAPRPRSRATQCAAGAWLATAPPRTATLPAFLPVLPPTDEYFKIPSDETQPPRSLEATGAVRVADALGPCVITAGPALTEEECCAWIAWGEVGGVNVTEKPRAIRGFKEEKLKRTAETAERVHGQLSVESPDVAEAIFRRLRPLLPDALYGKKPAGCNSDIRLYRYTEGQRFGRHVDGAKITPKGRTEFTVLMYLCECDGGATQFFRDHDGPTVLYEFQPAQGAVLLHAHGQRCLTHAGAPVRGGTKYLLRTDVVYQ